MQNAQLDFDPETLPWIDRPDADVDGYVSDLTAKLKQWREDGFVVFPGAVSNELIERYLADWDGLLQNNSKYSILVRSRSKGIVPVRQLTEAELNEVGLRLIDFHINSVTAKELALLRVVVDFLRIVFQEEIVAMQSLTFKYSSEQGLHQDYAFVVPRNPSHLAASWIALEDVHPDAGPLVYYAGSHRIPKFDWGNGLFLTPESTLREDSFERHIQTEVDRLGLKREVFAPKKGDVFLWHSALAHEGSKVKNRELTRKSFVTHYTSAPSFDLEVYTACRLATYPEELRNPPVQPTRYCYNGAYVYGDPVHPEYDDLFR
jgi:ectoine hydroxylase-related dioxygenase (phytanoyl-CoA dioxygenase family)